MDVEYVPGAVSIVRRRRTRGQRRENEKTSQENEQKDKKIQRNETESKRVWKINEQYDKLVVMLGGVVNGGKKTSRVWEREGSEGKLRKLDILEATTSYIRGLIGELEYARKVSLHCWL